jgi:hypothetical protein
MDDFDETKLISKRPAASTEGDKRKVCQNLPRIQHCIVLIVSPQEILLVSFLSFVNTEKKEETQRS